jgi:hypothetical protein
MDKTEPMTRKARAWVEKKWAQELEVLLVCWMDWSWEMPMGYEWVSQKGWKRVVPSETKKD